MAEGKKRKMCCSFILRRAARLGGALLALLVVTGCATLSDEGPRSYSTALPAPVATSPVAGLDRIAAASLAAAPAGHSGFRWLLGSGALDARVFLLRNAQRSLDLQYYHLHDDRTGRLVLRELRNAARRGVRVRLLLDDLYTEGLAPLLDGLGAYPNVEVRLFNPFPTRGGTARRFGAGLLDFARLNRRMHNKLFVADGVLAVTGGRNLGDAYFLRDAESNFFDYDVLAAGPVVPQMASLFDEYWNAPQVRTAASVLQPTDTPEALRRAFDARVDGAGTPEPGIYRGLDRLGYGPVLDELNAGRLRTLFGIAQAFADSPAKAWGERESAHLPSGALLDNSRLLLTQEFAKARHEVWLASPYLVPGPEALEGMRANVQRGVRIRLVTNSLAATDEPVVHTGYRRYRDNMLRAGVEIFELHPDVSRQMLPPDVAAGTVLRLHTKAGVQDGEFLFIGSVNFDPRSAELNTEFGLLIRSPAMAADARRMFEIFQQEGAYQVKLKEGTVRDLEWRRDDPQRGVEVLDSEPGADLLTRMKLYIQSFIIPEAML